MITRHGLRPAWSLAILAIPGLLLAQQAAPPSQAEPSRISLAEFKTLVDTNAVLVIDVRDAQSYAAGHIPGAVSIPLDELEKRIPRLKASGKPIVAYCA